MIDDKDIQFNMALYMGLLQDKYKNIKQKRVQLEMTLNNSARKIQRNYRRFIMKKKTRAAIALQRWWKIMLKRIKQRKQKLKKFKQLFYGIIICKFLQKNYFHKKPIPSEKNKKLSQKQTKQINILNLITKTFPYLITRKQALQTQHKYINKYRQYLKQKFNTDWEIYQKKITKQLWKQINRKWVKIETKNKDKQKQKINNMYLNEQDKQVDAQAYIRNKLNKIYEQNYDKLEETDKKLKYEQQEIIYAVQILQKRYVNSIVQKYQRNKQVFLG